MNEKIDLSRRMIYNYEGHTPAPWTYNDVEGREIWKCLFNGECFTDPSTYGKEGYDEVLIATMAPLPEGEDFPEEEFTTMMANKMLMADAPLLLAEVKRLRDFIQSVWDGLGEAGRNEHYELFREYMGEEE